MTMYKVRYKVQLETLTPVLITAGGEFSRLRHGYMHLVSGNVCSRFDGSIIDYLSSEDLREILRRYTEENVRLDKLLYNHAQKYKDKANKLYSEVKNPNVQFNCFPFVRDIKGNETPILPGSALKGAFTYFKNTKTSNEKEIDKGHLWSFPDVPLKWDDLFLGTVTVMKEDTVPKLVGFSPMQANYEMLKPGIKISFYLSAHENLKLLNELKNSEAMLKEKIEKRINALGPYLKQSTYETQLSRFKNAYFQSGEYLLQIGRGIMAEDPREALKDGRHKRGTEYRSFRKVTYNNKDYTVLGMCKVKILGEETC